VALLGGAGASFFGILGGGLGALAAVAGSSGGILGPTVMVWCMGSTFNFRILDSWITTCWWLSTRRKDTQPTLSTMPRTILVLPPPASTSYLTQSPATIVPGFAPGGGILVLILEDVQLVARS
jgi:hypothetical protein